MNAQNATTLILDCGTMVGHQQHELEVPQAAVPFLDVPAGRTSMYFSMRLSNGLMASFRGIYRPDNGMWRIEFSSGVPEIASGIFPVGSRRSNYAVLLTKIGGGVFDLRFVPVGSPEYSDELNNATASGTRDRTISGAGGREYGWY